MGQREGAERRITRAAVLKQGEKTRPPGESAGTYLDRATHVSLCGKGLTSMEHLDKTGPSIRVLYLFDNRITSICALRSTCITHLHLQDNCIETIDNLHALSSLVQLHLARNRIRRIAGLENLRSLQVLDVSDQRGDLPVELDPRSMQALAEGLVHLNISNNRMVSLQDVSCLASLETLRASNNAFADVHEACQVVGQLRSLREIDLQGAPFGLSPSKYRSAVIDAASSSLELLDGKAVRDEERCFVKRVMPSRRQVPVQKRTSAGWLVPI
ncbi:Protein phosphatase 1 regulatory subunit 7 [Plasmodiophora brassicae]